MKNSLKYFVIFLLFISTLLSVEAKDFAKSNSGKPTTFNNPILPGFHPDPSICRVNDDYYLITSSFTWYPGIPIYHSKDLVNWRLIGHAIDRPDMINFDGLDDNHGIWAPTIRYHNGLFYIITTANKAGGNFYITAKNPIGPWSDPIWIKDAPGIDPSLFWDDDKCYYTGNYWDFKKSWPSQCAVWMQEIDLEKGELIGERKELAYGHANNAKYAEGPHLYKVDGKYLLLMAEGGASSNHAVTVFLSNNVWGPYVAPEINPVLTHRHFGSDYLIQNLGHADLVQTQNGDWYSVVLGVRKIENNIPLARETFLCKIDFENGVPIYNKGYGRVLLNQERPDLPWTSVPEISSRDDFNGKYLSSDWYHVRNPQKGMYQLNKDGLKLFLKPETIDELSNSSMVLKKIIHHNFEVSAEMKFSTKKDNEAAGVVIYRSANGYYSLMKNRDSIVLTKKHMGKIEIVESVSYNNDKLFISISVENSNIYFYYGVTVNEKINIGGVQNVEAYSDNRFNKFNGPGVGFYATSNGEKSNSSASFNWFQYVYY